MNVVVIIKMVSIGFYRVYFLLEKRRVMMSEQIVQEENLFKILPMLKQIADSLRVLSDYKIELNETRVHLVQQLQELQKSYQELQKEMEQLKKPLWRRLFLK